mmetsp:Transcript_17262/g.60301  ORF Transcript_17262/g.60301 Transcript_17262/m.60301 type:complete len:335 (-) Transcript_17262:1060-2064(-)
MELRDPLLQALALVAPDQVTLLQGAKFIAEIVPILLVIGHLEGHSDDLALVLLAGVEAVLPRIILIASRNFDLVHVSADLQRILQRVEIRIVALLVEDQARSSADRQHHPGLREADKNLTTLWGDVDERPDKHAAMLGRTATNEHLMPGALQETRRKPVVFSVLAPREDLLESHTTGLRVLHHPSGVGAELAATVLVFVIAAEARPTFIYGLAVGGRRHGDVILTFEAALNLEAADTGLDQLRDVFQGHEVLRGEQVSSGVSKVYQIAVPHQAIRHPASLSALPSIRRPATPCLRGEALPTVGDTQSSMYKRLDLHARCVARNRSDLADAELAA